MAEAESLRQIAQSRAPLSAWLGTLLLFMLFGVIVLALVGPSARHDNYEQNRAKKRVDTLKGLREEDAKALTTYEWVDKAKGSAHIPIDRAMQLTATELAQKKPVAAYPVATPPPATAPAPVPAGQASPVPSAAPSTVPGAAQSSASSASPPSASSSSTAPVASPKPKANEGPQSEIRSQPAAAANPPAARPGTQPGATTTMHSSPAAPSSKPAASPTQSPAGSPLPVAGKTPSTF